ncbi:MAG: hypothetical protein A3C35_06915 [Omnitrophica bacterium RIFCSPHIGHO2_02_FULL_46_11]|nr:MAG: hypothetical protein A3C35_06915 [Omnitrophica bacterium RIFCSPHIGHO2_02_FULL_46_11]
MNFQIQPAKLKTWYQKGFVVPLVHRIQLKTDPWQVAKSLLVDTTNGFFLDSVRFQDKTARYSYLGWKPFRIFRTHDTRQVIPGLKRLLESYQGRKWPELPFFTGGAVGYLSYELAHAFEQLPDQAEDDLDLDRAAFLLVRDLLVFDHKDGTYFLVANLIPKEDGPFEKALQKAINALEGMKTQIGTVSENRDSSHVSASVDFAIRGFQADLSKRGFKEMVLRAKEYIEAGDIYQANLSQRFSFEFKGRLETLYESLRTINPSPFSSLLKVGPLAVASVSPERLIKLDGRVCQTRPIAGTRPRGKTDAQEQKLRRDLIMSPKERAEHIMLVDLERNDLSRVSEPKSVCVNELMTLERYSHVVHIVSNISGRLKKECDRWDLLRAVFPGGTITGCPKIRSMEIIEELEPFKRHLYTGSIGYLDFNGDMDFNIIIRSLIFYKGNGYLQVGAGIVYDSIPEAEYWETLHKGKALIDALCGCTSRSSLREGRKADEAIPRSEIASASLENDASQ